MNMRREEDPSAPDDGRPGDVGTPATTRTPAAGPVPIVHRRVEMAHVRHALETACTLAADLDWDVDGSVSYRDVTVTTSQDGGHLSILSPTGQLHLPRADPFLHQPSALELAAAWRASADDGRAWEDPAGRAMYRNLSGAALTLCAAAMATSREIEAAVVESGGVSRFSFVTAPSSMGLSTMITAPPLLEGFLIGMAPPFRSLHAYGSQLFGGGHAELARPDELGALDLLRVVRELPEGAVDELLVALPG